MPTTATPPAIALARLGQKEAVIVTALGVVLLAASPNRAQSPPRAAAAAVLDCWLPAATGTLGAAELAIRSTTGGNAPRDR